MTDQGPSRRTVLELAAGVTGAAAIGATGLAVADSTNQSGDEDAPSVEWVAAYEDRAQEYEIERIEDVHQIDEGYVLSGEGRPITPTGPEDEQFMLIQTDAEGNQQTISFARTDRDAENHVTYELVEMASGGYGLVGYLRQRTPDYRVESVSVAAAAKFSASGEPQWTATMDNLESGSGTETETATADGEGEEDPGDVYFTAAAADDDGGFVAGGGRTERRGSNPTGILVRYTSDGTLAWERRYDGLERVDQVFAHEGGYLLVGTDGERPVARLVDDEGTVERSLTLDVDLEETPHNHVFTPTADGGYAYTGRDDGRENVVLGRLDADGERLWRREYDGPYEGRDWGFDVLQTADGGFAVGGDMSEAYSGDAVPVVLKTDAEGTKQWQKLLKDATTATRYDTLVQTDDGGYACQIDQSIVKLGPADDGGSGSTGTPTETTQTPTPTEESTPGTEEPSETAEPTEGPPETATTDAPAPNTEESTPTEDGSDESGSECEI